MGIRNKDGTPYRLEGPNPIMAEQKSWDKDQMIVHNKLKFGQPILMEDQTEPIKQAFDKPVIIPKMQNFPEMPQDVPEIVETLESDEDLTSIVEGEIEVWCLPAKYIEVVDSIYDQKFKRLKYGK